MSVRVGELYAELKLDKREFQKGLAETEHGFGKVASAIKTGGLIIGAALVGIGVESLHMAAHFDSAMELVHTQAGATQAEVEDMKQSILDLAPKVGTGPDALAEALFHVESAGFRDKKALDVLTIAAEGARVGHADLTGVTNVLTGALNSGIKGIKNASQAMGVLNAIVGAGNMSMDQLTTAMSTGILSTAKSFGVSFQDVGAALADMSSQLIPPAKGAAALKMAISGMGAPTASATKTLAKLGLGHLQLAKAMRSPQGLMGALRMLQAHLKGLSKPEQADALKNIFGSKSSTAILTLLGDLGKFKDAQDAINKGTTAFGDAWATTQEEASQKMADINASMDVIGISIGETLMTPFKGFLDLIVQNLPAIRSLFTNVFTAIANVISWVATNVFPPLIDIWNKITTAVGPLVAAAFKTIGDALKWIGDTVGPPVKDLFKALGGIMDGVSKAWDSGMKALGPLVDLMGGPGVVAVGAIALALSTVLLPAAVGAAAALWALLAPMIPLIAFGLIVLGIVAAIGALNDAMAAGGEKAQPMLDKLSEINTTMGDTPAAAQAAQTAVVDDLVGDLKDNGVLGIGEFISTWTTMGNKIAGIDVFTTAATTAINDLLTKAKTVVDGVAFWMKVGLLSIKLFVDGILTKIQAAIDAVTTAINDAIDKLKALLGMGAQPGTGGTGPGGAGGGFALGTWRAPGGIAMVGERGPELAYLPRGTAVSDAAETRRILRGDGHGSGAPTIIMQVTGAVRAETPEDFGFELRRLAEMGMF